MNERKAPALDCQAVEDSRVRQVVGANQHESLAAAVIAVGGSTRAACQGEALPERPGPLGSKRTGTCGVARVGSNQGKIAAGPPQRRDHESTIHCPERRVGSVPSLPSRMVHTGGLLDRGWKEEPQVGR